MRIGAMIYNIFVFVTKLGRTIKRIFYISYLRNIDQIGSRET